MDRPTQIRARLARAVRAGEEAELIDELRREYYTARTAQQIREWLAGDPAPTAADRREVAALLVGAGDGGA